MFLLTKFLWKEKYCSKEEYKRFGCYSYKFRLIMCIITSIFTIPIDILFFIPEIIYWFCETLIKM